MGASHAVGHGTAATADLQNGARQLVAVRAQGRTTRRANDRHGTLRQKLLSTADMIGMDISSTCDSGVRHPDRTHVGGYWKSLHMVSTTVVWASSMR